MTTDSLERYWVPAGTIIHLAGFPVEVKEHTIVECHKTNWELIQQAMTFPPLAPLSLPDPPSSADPAKDEMTDSGEATLQAVIGQLEEYGA